MKITSLIVDFPSSTEPRAKSTMKSVRFQPRIDGRFISYPSRHENHAKWYSDEDYKHFQSVKLRDIMKYSIKLATINDGAPQDKATSQKLIVRCIGLEDFISRDVPKRFRDVKEARREHVRLVLDEQKWQRLENVDNPVDLARVSMASSHQSRRRSYKIAALAASVQ